MAKTAAPYVPVADKIAEQERIKASLMEQFNASTDEAQKSDLQNQIKDADRKIRWYQGRANSPKFQAKAERAQAAATTSAVVEDAPAETPTEAPAPEPTADPTPASVANEV